MKRLGGRGGRSDVSGQLQIEWSGASNPVRNTSPLPAPVAEPLVQRLKWDFSTTFPSPTEEAIEAGRVQPEDADPYNVKSIHEEHARELLATLHDLEAVLDARRRGVDPRNNKIPMLAEAKERLRKFFETEPARLERNYQNLLAVYVEVFGNEAAGAFDKAVRAWHAGIAVVAESKSGQMPPATENTPQHPVPSPEPSTPRRPRRHSSHRVTARLPVPLPLASAVAAGHFGQEENGKPVRPGPREVREITETHAEKLIALIDQLHSAPAVNRDRLQGEYANGLAAYAEDFGERAAQQLGAYVTRQAGLDAVSRRGR